MPNFVDCAVFRPFSSEEFSRRSVLLAGLGIPEAAFVVGCVAAVKKDHKRLDYLIREFALIHNVGGALRAATGPGRSQEITVAAAERASHIEEERIPREAAKAAKGNNILNMDEQDIQDGVLGDFPSESSCASCISMFNASSFPFLLIAGAKTSETLELVALAESLIPGRYKIMTDCDRARMPDLYHVMDVFVLTSLFEMMPIALLEALASGLPCLVNRHPVLEWMVGVEERSVGSGQCAVGKGQRVDKSASREAAKNAKGSNSSNIDEQDRQDGEFVDFSPELSCISCSSMLNPSLDAEAPTAHCSLRTAHSSAPTGGMSIDMSREGALAQALAGLTPEWLERHGRQARERALKMFSKEAVIGQYVDYYRDVLNPSLDADASTAHREGVRCET